MGLITLGALAASDLPASSHFSSPEAIFLTLVTLACLGLAVMLLLRRRAQTSDAEESHPCEEGYPAVATGPAQETHQPAPEPLAALAIPMDTATPLAVVCAAEPGAQPTCVVSKPVEPICATGVDSMDAALDLNQSTSRSAPEMSTDVRGVAAQTAAPARGASALMAKAAQLLPKVLPPAAGESKRSRSSRNPSGFQPGGRFSRSQQAFLRIPVVLTGGEEAGGEFREESATLILLPQGAVIPTKQRLRAGDGLVLTIPSRQQQVSCRVFGAHQGPDGKMLIEIEFAEPHKNLWPVSFPAWAGDVSRTARGSTPARTPALDRAGS